MLWGSCFGSRCNNRDVSAGSKLNFLFWTIKRSLIIDCTSWGYVRVILLFVFRPWLWESLLRALCLRDQRFLLSPKLLFLILVLCLSKMRRSYTYWRMIVESRYKIHLFISNCLNPLFSIPLHAKRYNWCCPCFCP